jgi:hypothetical protein
MSHSKIEVNVGGVAFSGEGEQAWLAEQLDKVLKAAPEIARAKPQDPVASSLTEGSSSGGGNKFATTLSAYIRDKGGDDSQVDRFLITADWLRRRGASKLTTSAISKALKDNQQKRLVNSADCLNKNVSKGFCEKADGGFYITPDGLRKLGH